MCAEIGKQKKSRVGSKGERFNRPQRLKNREHVKSPSLTGRRKRVVESYLTQK